jgi:hypothetical protein
VDTAALLAQLKEQQNAAARPGADVLLSDENFREAAVLLGCDIPAVKAVAEVEGSGCGFLIDRRPKVLFEGHKFAQFTRNRHNATAPEISYLTWDRKRYASGSNADERGKGEWERLMYAMEFDLSAALMSASWGRFQIMGFNAHPSGYTDIIDFAIAMATDERLQLIAFVNYLRSTGLDDELQRHDWTNFARLYNGPRYYDNQYHTKLATAWKKHGGK